MALASETESFMEFLAFSLPRRRARRVAWERITGEGAARRREGGGDGIHDASLFRCGAPQQSE